MYLVKIKRKIRSFCKQYTIRLIFCSFCVSLVVALIHTVFILHLALGILGLTVFLSGVLGVVTRVYFQNGKIHNQNFIRLITPEVTTEISNNQTKNDKNDDYRNEINERDYVGENPIETTDNININTGGGDYNEHVGRDVIGRDSVTKNIKNITVGNREVEINPNNIIKTFDELRDVLIQSIAQSSNALEAISNFANELTAKISKNPEVKSSFNLDENITKQELLKTIFNDLLTIKHDLVNEVNNINLLTQTNQNQKITFSNSSGFIEDFKYCGNDEYEILYKRYIIHLFPDQSKSWLCRIRRKDGSFLETDYINKRSGNIYLAIGKAINAIDKELGENWKNSMSNPK